MIGYSIASDNAYTPGPSNSIYISKTNQKFSISYIPILRHYRKKNFRNKSLHQHGSSYVCYVHSEDFSLLQFTLYQYILRYGVFGDSKNQRNPIPKHVELQIISTYSNQWPTNTNRCWSTHFSANFKIRQKLKKNTKADIPINKLFEEKLFDHQFHQSQNLLLTEKAVCISNRGRLGSERKV